MTENRDMDIDSHTITLKEDQRSYTVQTLHSELVVSKKTGLLTGWKVNGKQLLLKPVTFSTYRAPADNDRYIKEEWIKAGYDRNAVKVYDYNARHDSQAVYLNFTLSIASVSIQPFLKINLMWVINANGEVTLQLHGDRNIEFPFLPRFGLLFTLPYEMGKHVTYYGYGPQESYIDKHRASYVDLFSTDADHMHVDYIKPQENGNHYHCSFLKAGVFEAYGAPCFDLSVSHYALSELCTKKHNFELEKSDVTYVYTDFMNSGIGSGSCGPQLLPEYRFDQQEFDWCMRYRIGDDL